MTPTLSGSEVDNLVGTLKICANTARIRFLAYAGHWDGPEWVLVQMAQDIRTKRLGRVLVKGEYTIARLEADKSVWRVWSRKLHDDMIVGLDKVVKIERA